MPALEENILKYRALQMVLFIFHAESLKRFVDGAVDGEEFLRQIGSAVPTRSNKQKRQGTTSRWEKLVDRGVLSEAEVKDLQQLNDYRNRIAHEIHTLTEDVGESRPRFTPARSRYSYAALERLEAYRRKIDERMPADFVIPISGDRFFFDSAERAYRKELARLDRRINRQLATRRAQIERLKIEISGLDRSVHRHLGRIVTTTDRGTLTTEGAKMCSRLFELGVSTSAMTRLLGISPRSIKRRQAQWRRQNVEPRTPSSRHDPAATSPE